MNNLTTMPFEFNDTIQQRQVKLWGNGWNKLTPKQQELVSEILRNLKQRGVEAC
jgi:ABC-type transporter lipoprotein component MlaA